MSRPTSRVSRVLMTGPLAPFADAYSAELQGRGYTPLTTVVELRKVGRLSRWLEASGLSVAELSVERVEQFLVWQRAGDGITCMPARFRSWLWAATLDDLAHLGRALVAAGVA